VVGSQLIPESQQYLKNGHFDAFLELKDMEDIMNGCQLRRKMNSVSHWAIDFKDFEWSDILGC
jgi:hypothetical protein